MSDVSQDPQTTNDLGDEVVSHLELARLVERVHRRYLDLLRFDLARMGIHDISPTQVMVLLTVGTSEISVRDLLDRGYYLGSNASYNLKQLVASGYLDRSASQRDRRLARIKLSQRGLELCERLRASDQAYQSRVCSTDEDRANFETTYATLRRLEQIWSNTLRYGA